MALLYGRAERFTAQNGGFPARADGHGTGTNTLEIDFGRHVWG
jgi:hypothetical protein